MTRRNDSQRAARDYMRQNPGTKYREALAIVTGKTPQATPAAVATHVPLEGFAAEFDNRELNALIVTLAEITNNVDLSQFDEFLSSAQVEVAEKAFSLWKADLFDDEAEDICDECGATMGAEMVGREHEKFCSLHTENVHFNCVRCGTLVHRDEDNMIVDKQGIGVCLDYIGHKGNDEFHPMHVEYASTMRDDDEQYAVHLATPRLVTVDEASTSGNSCAECGEPMMLDENEVSHHLTPEGGIDYEADADHVALDDQQYGI